MDYAQATGSMVNHGGNAANQLCNIQMQRATLSWLAEETVGLHGMRPVIADYGCGAGASTLSAVAPVVQRWQSHWECKHPHVYFIDQPGNDWAALQTAVAGPEGFASGSATPTVEYVSGDFYDQVLPDRSVVLATAFYSTHWLRRTGFPASGSAMWFCDLPRKQFNNMREIARRDFARFIDMRLRELVPGGYLVVSTMGSVPDDAAEIGIAPSLSLMMPFARSAFWRMGSEGLLDEDVADAFLMPVWHLSTEDVRAAISDYCILEDTCKVKWLEVECRSQADTDTSGSNLGTTLERYLQGQVYAARAALETCLMEHLFLPSSKTAEQALSLSDMFFQRMKAAMRADLTADADRQHFEETKILRLVIQKK